MVSVDGTTPRGEVTLRTTVNEVVVKSWAVRISITGTGVTVVGANGIDVFILGALGSHLLVLGLGVADTDLLVFGLGVLGLA
jgi:hypothetical protein